MPLRIISGGQAGVDRAALDAALDAGIEVGGWCPSGRRAEDGNLDARYPLKETPSEDYAQRTEWNVRDSDATLVITRGAPSGGTAYTIAIAERDDKPLLVIDLESDKIQNLIGEAAAWTAAHGITALNVAGPRDTVSPGIYNTAYKFISKLLKTAAVDERAQS